MINNNVRPSRCSYIQVEIGLGLIIDNSYYMF